MSSTRRARTPQALARRDAPSALLDSSVDVPPRSGKSFCLVKSTKPTVEQGPRTPRNLQADRIAKGGTYPRNESIHSLQFASPIEAMAVRGKPARELTPSTEAESMEEYSSTETITFRPGRIGFDCDWVTGSVHEVFDVGQAKSAGVQRGWRMVKINGAPYAEKLLDDRIGGVELYDVTFAQDDQTDELVQQTPRTARFAPEPVEAVVEVPPMWQKPMQHGNRIPLPSGPPPRSGKDMFLSKTSRPAVTRNDPAPTQPQLTPGMERICRGESAVDKKDKKALVPQARSPTIPVKPVSAHPTMRFDLEAAYPRNGSVHSLQYRSPHERAGAQQAPDPIGHAASRPVQPVAALLDATLHFVMSEEELPGVSFEQDVGALCVQDVSEDAEHIANCSQKLDEPEQLGLHDCLGAFEPDKVQFAPSPRQRRSTLEVQPPQKPRKPFR